MIAKQSDLASARLCDGMRSQSDSESTGSSSDLARSVDSDVKDAGHSYWAGTGGDRICKSRF